MNCHRNAHLGRAAFALGFVWIFLCASSVHAQQTTAFTYQGRLTDSGTAANASYDLQFALFDNSSGGTQIGSTLTRSSVAVSGGVFTVQLDFGVSAFPGADRFLEIGVRPASVGSFATLAPRQQISSTPYAIRTLSAATADTATNATQLGGIAASSYVQTNDSRLTDSRPPTAGSSNYIQNTTPGAGTNFNISGNGTAAGTFSSNVVNTTTQYNLGGARILSNAGTQNLFAGIGAGSANTTGCCSAFFGFNAGAVSNVNDNSFFGNSAGAATTTGGRNSFFGSAAGLSNVSGVGNSFFGVSAGRNNLGDNSDNGNANSFFGDSAGSRNTGSRNSFFGASAGQQTAARNDNSLFGYGAGTANTGNQNNFFGVNAGYINDGSLNNFFGYQAGLNNTAGSANNFFGAYAGAGQPSGSTGGLNNFFGQGAGTSIQTGERNSFFGHATGSLITTGSNNTFIGASAGNPSISNQVFYSTAIGYNANVGCSHCMVLGDASDSSLQVGIGTTSPAASLARLYVNGGGSFDGVRGSSTDGDGVYGSSVSNAGVVGTSTNSYGVYGSSANGYAGYFNGKAVVTGHLQVGAANGQVMLTVASIPPANNTFSGHVCFNPQGDLLNCDQSSLRFKTNVHPFLGGLDIVRQLHPINFTWKANGLRDIGLGAEDVAKVAPGFVTSNDKGEVAGVKYDRLNIVLINAVKEQQKEIELQHKAITQLKEQVRRLRASSRPQRRR